MAASEQCPNCKSAVQRKRNRCTWKEPEKGVSVSSVDVDGERERMVSKEKEDDEKARQKYCTSHDKKVIPFHGCSKQSSRSTQGLGLNRSFILFYFYILSLGLASVTQIDAWQSPIASQHPYFSRSRNRPATLTFFRMSPYQRVQPWQQQTSTTALFDSEMTTVRTRSSTSTTTTTTTKYNNMTDTTLRFTDERNGVAWIDPLPLTADTTPDVPLPTENGGYTHTTASKAKISAANKGKTPWNKGQARSEETRARIAAGVRAKNRERHLAKLAALNLTEVEWEAQQAAERRRLAAERAARRTENGGYRPTNETRQKISRILKEKHATGQVKRATVHPSKVRRGFTHSEETRRKISESLRQRWASDPNYRQNMKEKTAVASSREETRRRISESLRQKWQDPEFRERMLHKIANRTSATGTWDQSHRARISQAMKLKWQDEEYRQKTLKSIAQSQKKRSLTTTTSNVAHHNPRETIVADVATQKTIQPRDQTTTTNNNNIDDDDCNSPILRTITGTTRGLRGRERNPGVAAAMTPLQPIERATKKKKKKAKKKKSIVVKSVPKKATPGSPTSAATDTAADGDTSSTGTTVKSDENKTPNDGDVSQLREERRDLYDLLYGDEDMDENHHHHHNNNNDLNAGRSRIASMGLEHPQEAIMSMDMPITTNHRLAGIFADLGDDENLDTFDPYGLDDF